jgi:hypothetical protein
MNMAVLCIVAQCSQGDEPLIALMMEAARSSETLVKFYQTTRRYNPEDHHLHPIISATRAGIRPTDPSIF